MSVMPAAERPWPAASDLVETFLRNPYRVDADTQRRVLELDPRWPSEASGWKSWWRGLKDYEQRDPAVVLALLAGLGEEHFAEVRSWSSALANALQGQEVDSSAEIVCRTVAVKKALDALVGNSDGMRRVREEAWAAAFGQQLETVAGMTKLFRTTPVLIEGETGTGKELVARALLQSMPGQYTSMGWKPCPADAVHLASMPQNLVQSALFGHEKGAYSGAVRERTGVFAKCHRGVVFLDELAELPADTQVALLRTLQEGKARRLGSDDDHDAAPRVVSATHENLEELVARSEFRLDLLHRLSSAVIRVPPLRDRREDIPLLVEHEIRSLASPSARPGLLDRWEVFMKEHGDHDWPGNVRELHAAVRALALGLPPRLRKRTRKTKEPKITVPPGLADSTWTLREAQRWYCQRVVEATDGNRVQAARSLDIVRSTLRSHLAEDDDER